MILYYYACTILFTVTCESLPLDREYSTNVGTVLFSASDIHKKQWGKSEIGLLQARKYFQNLLPPPIFINTFNEDHVNILLAYFKDAYAAIKKEAKDLETDTIMTTALSDAIGGYLKVWVLPVAKLDYYGGTISQGNVVKLFQFYNEIKRYLDTNGEGWRTPDEQMLNSMTINVAPLQLFSNTRSMKDPCDHLAYFEKTPTGLSIPTPNVNWNDKSSTMFVPLKNASLILMNTPDTSHNLIKYYDAARSCIQTSNPKQQKHFDEKFQKWLIDDVVPHLKDDNLYLALGSVLTLVNRTQDLCNDVLDLSKQKPKPKKKPKICIPCDISSKKMWIIIIILLIEIAWCVPALIFVLCFKKLQKKDCSSNVYLFIDNDKKDKDKKTCFGDTCSACIENTPDGPQILRKTVYSNIEFRGQCPSKGTGAETGTIPCREISSEVCLDRICAIETKTPEMCCDVPKKSSLKKMTSTQYCNSIQMLALTSHENFGSKQSGASCMSITSKCFPAVADVPSKSKKRWDKDEYRRLDDRKRSDDCFKKPNERKQNEDCIKLEEHRKLQERIQAEEYRKLQERRQAEEYRKLQERRQAEECRNLQERRQAEERRKLQERRQAEECRNLQERRQTIEYRKLEEQRQAEECRKLEEQRQSEECKKVRERQQIEECRKIEERRQAEEFRKIEERRQAEEFRRLEERRQAEECRKLEELKQAEECRNFEERRQDIDCRKLEERTPAEECKKLEERRQAEACRKLQKNKQSAEYRKLEERRQAEECRKLEERRQAEECRKLEELKQAEECRKLKELKQAEECRKLEKNKQSLVCRKREERRHAEECRKLEERRQAEECRKLEERRQAEECRKLEERRKAEECRKLEERRKAEECRKLEERRQAEECRKLEERRQAEECRKLEERRQAEECRKLEERRLAEERRKLEERRQAEECRKLEEQKQAEECRKLEERRQGEECRKLEERRKAEQCRKLEERKQAEECRKLEEQKQAEECRKLEERRMLEACQKLRQLDECRKSDDNRKRDELRKLDECRKLQDRKIREACKKFEDRKKLEESRKQDESEVDECKKFEERRKLEECRRRKKAELCKHLEEKKKLDECRILDKLTKIECRQMEELRNLDECRDIDQCLDIDKCSDYDESRKYEESREFYVDDSSSVNEVQSNNFETGRDNTDDCNDYNAYNEPMCCRQIVTQETPYSPICPCTGCDEKQSSIDSNLTCCGMSLSDMQCPSDRQVDTKTPRIKVKKELKTKGGKVDSKSYSGKPYLEITIDRPGTEICVDMSQCRTHSSSNKPSKIPKPATCSIIQPASGRQTTGSSPDDKHKSLIPQLKKKTTDDLDLAQCHCSISSESKLNVSF